jgi:hypothetical protein
MICESRNGRGDLAMSFLDHLTNFASVSSGRLQPMRWLRGSWLFAEDLYNLASAPIRIEPRLHLAVFPPTRYFRL